MDPPFADTSQRAPEGRRRHLPGAGLVAPLLVLAACVVGWDIATRVLDVSSRVLPSPGLVARSTWDDRANLWPAI